MSDPMTPEVREWMKRTEMARASTSSCTKGRPAASRLRHQLASGFSRTSASESRPVMGGQRARSISAAISCCVAPLHAGHPR